MHHQIIFTPADLYEVLAFAVFIVGIISALIGFVIKTITKLKQPDHDQDVKIANHEQRIGIIEEKLQHDKERFDRLEKSMWVYQDGMRALINHDLHGNNLGELQNCLDELDKAKEENRKPYD